MEQVYSFEAQLVGHDSGGSFCIPPLDVPATFGKKGQVRVRGTIDGYAFQSTLAPMGGRHLLMVHKATREAIGKQPGEVVSITMQQDTAERTVEVPEDLAQALATVSGARATFDQLAYTHRKEYVRWITEAKKAETRLRRLTEAVALITTGKKLS
ncbi:YdeI/OmpD-associated family protein [Hymenobacter chitinivorans]|uniref:Uncharacterized protein DUF1905 n=1 Tax=Hymenobacter chitinivorans DSM 11115 TaxID=1121954 RepID=A0A2M9AR19_9BACT|nr:YdeI/OmpD-associated family protein [Hymenobacter chitinivorans]PJJ48083.1 uncharacterized protein DUF1905 [Hymenobacter chitinivorans DSM 11115]